MDLSSFHDTTPLSSHFMISFIVSFNNSFYSFVYDFPTLSANTRRTSIPLRFISVILAFLCIAYVFYVENCPQLPLASVYFKSYLSISLLIVFFKLFLLHTNHFTVTINLVLHYSVSGKSFSRGTVTL